MPSNKARSRGTAVSIVAHALVIAALWAAFHAARLTKIVTPGEQTGSVVTAVYSPADGYEAAAKALRAASSSSARPPRPAPPLTRSNAVLRLPQAPQPDAGQAQIASQESDASAASGLDSLGEGDVRIALGSFIPQPKPDFRAFPRGFEGNVVVDVRIDEQGRIRDKKLVRGISPAVDSIVLATLDSWLFSPAERGGNAVSSEQELLFHYGPV